jgi:hypothetical protein
MRSRILLLSSLMLVAVACSSSSSKDNKSDPVPPPDNPPSGGGSGGVDASTDPPVVDAGNTGVDSSSPSTDSGPKDPTNQAECIAVCEKKYPTPAAQNKLLDTSCMLGSCEPVCNNIGSSGKNFPPDVDPEVGVVCDTNAANSYPISTPSSACSTCLANTAECCTLWIAIFGSTDGQALNTCANTCFNTFAK